MAGHHSISYSSVDGANFSLELCDARTSGPPSFPAWLDPHGQRLCGDWNDQLVEAIRTGGNLLCVMPPDSMDIKSVCKQGGRALPKDPSHLSVRRVRS